MKFDKRIVLHILIPIIVYLIFFIFIKDYPLESDSLGYHQQSFNLSSHNIDDYYWPPLMPIFLNVTHYLFSNSELTSRLAMSFLYILFIVFMAQYILKEDKKINSIFFVLVCINPFTLFSFSQPDTQAPMMLLLVILLYFIYNYKSNILISLIIGIILGFCVLLRASSIVLIAPVMIYFIIKKVGFRYLLSIFLPFIVIILSWIGYVSFLTSNIVYINTANSMNLFLGNNKYVLVTNSSSTRGVKSGLESEYKNLCDSIKKFDYLKRDKTYRALTYSYLYNEKQHFAQRTFFRFINFFNFNTLTTGFVQSNFHSFQFTIFIFIFESSFSILVWLTFFITIITKWKILLNYKNDNSLYFLFCIISIIIYALPHFLTLSHPTYANGILPLIITIPIWGGVFESFSIFIEYFKISKKPIILLVLVLLLNNLNWLISMLKYL